MYWVWKLRLYILLLAMLATGWILRDWTPLQIAAQTVQSLGDKLPW